ncbi:MAG: 3-hydroxyacyl-ACP dehydratase FabZ, partial [Proteobacteria bacterium]
MEVRKYGPYDIYKVRNYLPHRSPFLFVDKILDIQVPIDDNGNVVAVGTKVVGQKNATINEPYFMGHFPEYPITPGVVMIETMAQISCFAVLPWVTTDENLKVTSAFDLRLAGVDATRFRKPFIPGDNLIVTVECVKQRGPIWGFKCKGVIDGAIVVESEILASVILEGGKK